MENLLIINFGTESDIIAMAHLLHSILREKPKTQITCLIFKESAKTIKGLRNLAKFHCLDRKKIVLLKKSKIFSKALVLNKFHAELEELKKISFDKIINYSNCTLGSYLVSYFNPTHFDGIKMGVEGMTNASNPWARLVNDVLSKYPYPAFHHIDYRHLIIGVPLEQGREDGLYTSMENNQIVYKNLNALRKKLNKDGNDVRLVGISLKSQNQKSPPLPIKLVNEIITTFLKGKSFYPLLLISSSPEEKEWVNEINGNFEDKILSVETDHFACPSVLLNLDLIITESGAIKHMADLLQTPCLEISQGGYAPWKHGTILEGSYLLTPVAGGTSDSSNSFSYTSQDVSQAVHKIFNMIELNDFQLSPNITLYTPKKDQTGIWYHPIAGTINVHFEISLLMTKYFAHALITSKFHDSIVEYLKINFNENELHEWVAHQRESINQVVAVFLEANKMLYTDGDIKDKGKEMSRLIDDILTFCNGSSLVSVPCLLFKVEIESLTVKSVEENFKEAGKLLVTLKRHIQLLTKTLSRFNTLALNLEEQNTSTREGTKQADKIWPV